MVIKCILKYLGCKYQNLTSTVKTNNAIDDKKNDFVQGHGTKSSPSWYKSQLCYETNNLSSSK